MAIAFRAAGTVAHSTGALASVALPSGHTTNDILLMVVETSCQTPPATWPPTGWVEVADSPQATPSVNAGAAAANTQIHVLWKRDNGSESAPAVGDSGNHTMAVIVAYSGCITSGDPWDVTTGGASATNDTSLSMGGDTTTVANTMVVACVALSIGDATTEGGAEITGWANSDLGSVTERVDYQTIDGNDGVIGIMDGTKAAAGSFGNTTATLDQAARKAWVIIALKPDAAATNAPAGHASGTGTAYSATVQTSSPNAPAGHIAVTGAASGVTAKVSPHAGHAAATGAANNATVSTETPTVDVVAFEVHTTNEDFYQGTHGTYATARAGGTGDSNVGVWATTVGQRVVTGIYDVTEGFFELILDLSPGATLISAVVAINITADSSTQDFTLELRTGNTYHSFVAGDDLSGLTLVASLDTSTISGTGFKDLVSNGSMVGAIDPNGTTQFVLSSSRQRTNNAPASGSPEGVAYSGPSDADSAKRPTLTITYTVGTGNAPAGVGTGTGTANDAQASIKPSAENAAGTGTASSATTKVSPTANAATATGTAYAPGGSASLGSVGVASGTGAAFNATVATSVVGSAGAATGTGAAGDATVKVAPTANVATGTGTAFAPGGDATFTSGVATATGQAFDATVTVGTSAQAEAATGTGTSSSPSVTVSTNVNTAAGSGAANTPSISIAPHAGVASGTGQAFDATATTSTTASAGAATGTGAAGAATVKVAPVVAAATATGTAYDAVVTVSGETVAQAGHASGTGAAGAPQIAIATASGAATGTGSSGTPSDAIAASGVTAAGSGAAQAATLSVAPVVGGAPGAGAAFDATVTTSSATSANAGTASGTGQAFNASTTTPTVAILGTATISDAELWTARASDQGLAGAAIGDSHFGPSIVDNPTGTIVVSDTALATASVSDE
jgi:hypothetical protein